MILSLLFMNLLDILWAWLTRVITFLLISVKTEEKSSAELNHKNLRISGSLILAKNIEKYSYVL